jgi:uncharacterized membrane protein
MSQSLPVLPWTQRAAARLLLCILLGALAGYLCPSPDFWVNGLVGWDVGATTLFLIHLVVICTSDVEVSRQRAASWDPGRFTVWLLVCAGCLFSLVASLVMIGDHPPEVPKQTIIPLCLWAVMASWFLTHSAYTLRYAHLYYRGDDVGGLEFPGGQPPDDLDFAYFAFTVGMAFQVSDVCVSDRLIRRNTLLHGLISFIFSTAILALCLNLIFGHLAG